MLKKIIKLNNIFLITLTMMFSFVTISSVEYSFAQNKNATSLVSCGFGDFNNKCTMANIFDTANKLAGFIIKVIFPTVFFVALGMVLLPLVRDPTNPSVRAEAKSKVKPLLIGAVCVVGAYLVIGVVLRSVGVEKDIIKKAIGYNIIGIEIARAEEDCPVGQIYDARLLTENKCRSTDNRTNTEEAQKLISNEKKNNSSSGSNNKSFFPNPLGDNTVQNLLLGIANTVVYILVLAGGYCILRGGLGLLLYGRNNPAKLKETKWWFFVGGIIVVFAFGAEYIISTVYNTAEDFVQNTGGTISDITK